MRRCGPWILALCFAGCPMEMKCATTEPRPGPASLSEANAELVRGLEECGYLSEGLRGEVSLIAFEADGTADDPCAWQCIADLRDDCEALVELACRSDVPDDLSRCVRHCSGCEGARCTASAARTDSSRGDCLDGSAEATSYGCARLRCDLAEEELER